MKIVLVRLLSIIDVSSSSVLICPPVGLAHFKSVVNMLCDDLVDIGSIGGEHKTA